MCESVLGFRVPNLGEAYPSECMDMRVLSMTWVFPSAFGLEVGLFKYGFSQSMGQWPPKA